MTIEQWAIDRVKPYHRNARKIPEKAIAKVATSLAQFGWKQPLVVDPQGVIIVGHTRLLAAKKLGMTHVPVLVAKDLTPAQVKAYRLMDNRSHDETAWDLDLLGLEMADLKMENIDLEFTGFDLPEIEGFLAVGRDGEKADECPALPETPVTRYGDVWLLGPHRLVCGDSTNAEDVGKAMSGAKPNLMVTDPPYGVEYDPAWRSSLDSIDRATNAVQNDHEAIWDSALKLFGGDVMYLWHAGSKAGETAAMLHSMGFQIRAQIMWRKPMFVISRGHYHAQHEPCWYAVRKGKTANWCGDRKNSTVWDVANALFQGKGLQDVADKHKTGHGTQKPVELMRRPILNHTKRGDAVYDPFLGSGTTLIAAHELERVCHGLEIDPKYCDVIVQRWQTFAEKSATLEENGRTFERVAKDRKVK